MPDRGKRLGKEIEMKVQYRISLIIIIAGGLFLLLGVWSGLMQIKAASNESEIGKNERPPLKQPVQFEIREEIETVVQG